jgi:hypothetical protein
LIGGNVLTGFQENTTAIVIQAAHRSMFNQPVAGLFSRFSPMGNDFVTANRTGSGFKQASEVCFWL